MDIEKPPGLAGKLDYLNEMFFSGVEPDDDERRDMAAWIASRQGMDGAYGGTFALTEREREEGIRLFTGERVTYAAARHISGEEAIKALVLLGVTNDNVLRALKRARSNMIDRLDGSDARGFFCCGPCSVSLWRNANAGGLDRSEERLENGLSILKSSRKDDSQWRRFPFYYTLPALHEIGSPAAVEEMRYAAPKLERMVSRKARDKYGERRKELARRILDRLGRNGIRS